MKKRVALVTGGTGGIGSAICRELAGLGHVVVAGYYPPEKESADAWQERKRGKGFSIPIVPIDVSSYEDYGSLSKRNLREMIAGSRVEVAPYKKAAHDFVLWKPSTPDLPGWESPWGVGRPGWHIECSAMAAKHLGRTIDIHGGGQDLVFPHHENESAQSRCAHDGEDFARYWVHNGFLSIDHEKMSKSLGNTLVVHELLKKYPGEVLRYLLLSAHYRQPLDWSEETLTRVQRTIA